LVLLVLKEVLLFLTLSSEIEVEPFEELALKDEHVGEIILIHGCVNDNGNIIICKLDFSLELL